jgi:glucose 1-dehydrogenase
MDGKLCGKRALITGASDGIGRAIAEAFVAEGAHVFLTAHTNPAGLSHALAAAGERGLLTGCMQADASTMPVDHIFAAACQSIGHVDVLVNNPGYVSGVPFLEADGNEFERSVAVNFRFPFFLTQRFAADCVSTGRPGSVINVSSISAFRAVSRLTTYQATKAALTMLTKGCAVELAQYGIRVNAISPGLTATKGNAHQWRDQPDLWASRGKDIPLGRAGRPADMVGAAILLASDESTWITGADIVIDGGESCL